MILALNRLRVGRYTLLVSATNAAGKSVRARVPVKVTWKLRYRALSAQKAAAAKAAPAATASVPVVGAAATATAAPSARPAAAASSTASPAGPGTTRRSALAPRGRGRRSG